MPRFIDIVGEKFGEWTVVEKAGYNKHKALLWRVSCSCGSIALRTKNNLKHSNSCGCKTKERMSLARRGKPSTARKAYGVSTFNMLRRRYVNRAKEKDIEYSLSDNFLKDTFKKDCMYCGSPPKSVMRTKETYGEYVYNGLDRIDSSQGYTEDNVVACCTRCNQMKNDMSVPEFFKKIGEVYARWISGGTFLQDFLSRNKS